MTTHTYVQTVYKDLLAIAAKAGKTVYQNEFNKLSNLKAVRDKESNHVRLQDLFRAYWPSFKAKHSNLRSSIIENVEAMIDCKDLSKRHIFYECLKCPNYHLIGFSCHSRFCASCGHKYRDARSIEIQNKLFKVPHRHFVFSVPFDLRPYFWHCRKLFDCLFKSVNEALHFTIRTSKKDLENDLRLGFVSFLHTSGRSLNPHPYLHVLLAEAGVTKDGKMKRIYYFPFERLRKTVMFKFLTNASNVLKDYGDIKLYRSFNILRSKIAKQYKDGFYTYGQKNANGDNSSESSKLYNSKKVAAYIARYASHPLIAESNILALDEDNHEVAWQYVPHDDEESVIITKEHPHDFIAKLIRHIHDKGFHQIRYYGFYANKSKRSKLFSKMLKPSAVDYLKSRLKWRIILLHTFKYDPLICMCGSRMVFNFHKSFIPEKRGFISDAYIL